MVFNNSLLLVFLSRFVLENVWPRQNPDCLDSDWLTSQQLSNLTLLQPEKSKPAGLAVTKAQSLDSSYCVTSPALTQPDIDDPFDAEWVDLAMRKEKRINASTNPFLEDSVKTFQLNM